MCNLRSLSVISTVRLGVNGSQPSITPALTAASGTLISNEKVSSSSKTVSLIMGISTDCLVDPARKVTV